MIEFEKNLRGSKKPTIIAVSGVIMILSAANFPLLDEKRSLSLYNGLSTAYVAVMCGVMMYYLFKDKWKIALGIFLGSSVAGLALRIIIEWGEASMIAHLNAFNVVSTFVAYSMGPFVIYLLMRLIDDREKGR